MQDFSDFKKKIICNANFQGCPLFSLEFERNLNGIFSANPVFLIMLLKVANCDNTKKRKSSQGHWLVRFPPLLSRKCKKKKKKVALC